MSVSRTVNPNWRRDAGMLAEPRCVCGCRKWNHALIGNKGCHATLNEPTELYRGPCGTCACKRWEPDDA